MNRSPLQVGRAIWLGVILIGAIPAFAEDGRGDTNDQVVRTGGAGSQDAVTRHLRKRFPQLEIGEIAPTPVKGATVVKVGASSLATCRPTGF